jgi:hypothetical protein
MQRQLDESLFTDFPSEEELMSMIMHTSATVWEHQLVKKDIEKWLSNFKGELFSLEHERLIALWLLSHFTFYNENEVKHLCKVIYRDLIHFILEDNSKANLEPSILVSSFFNKTNVISAEKTSGSGGFIAYFFRHMNDLPFDKIFNDSITKITDDIENIIILDDATFTAGVKGQMARFLKNNATKHASKKFYLLTLLASEAAIEYLTSTYNVKVISAIRLDTRDKCFSSESDVFSSFPNFIQLGYEFAEYYGKKTKPDHPLGYEDAQFTFGFHYNTPNNTLPIFWAQTKGWIPIINRYDKNFGSRGFLTNERFI